MAEQELTTGPTLHLEDSGSGQPIVFVHGVMMSGRFFQRQLPHFSTHHRAVIPDLRGHGQSEKVLSGHTVANYARDLHDLFQLRHVEKPALVGWSMGAMVVYEYLKQFGFDSVKGIVIVDQPPSDFAWEGYPFGVMTVEVLGQFVEGLQLDQQAIAEEFHELMVHEPSAATHWMVEEIMRVPAAIATSILVNQTLQDYRPLLPTITTPSLVLFGRDPKLTSPEAGQYTANEIPHARFEVFEESSHCPFYEEAARFNQVVEEFVASLD